MATPTKKPASAPEPVERGMIADVLTYPVRSGGWLMIVIGTGLSILISISEWSRFFAPLSGILGIVALTFGAGFFASYYFDIISATVNDSDDPPDWPNITNFMDDIVSPLLKLLGLLLIAGAPLTLALLLDESSPAKEPCVVAGHTFFALYFPMATLGYIMHGHMGGAMPHRVLPAIVRTLPGYLVVVLLFGALAMLSTWSDTIASTVPIVGIALSAAPSLYLLMAEARLIGLLYRSHREKIEWG